ncbi:DUF4382 domain-containing protein [Chloroflexota bacterium]
MKKTAGILLIAAISTLLVFTTSCTAAVTDDDEEKTTEEEITAEEEVTAGKTGTIEIMVTDPPPADVKSAIVQLSKIEVHRSSGNSSESDNNSAGWITLLEEPASFDLMEVIGVEQLLGTITVEAGKYTQIRMDVTEVSGETTDGESYTAEVPGDKLKIVRGFTVEEGETTALTLDFDGEKSLIRTGKGRYMFKPTVKLSIDYRGEAKQEQEKEQEKEREQGDEPGQEQEQEQEQESGQTEFEGIIESISGDNWTVSINSENITVNVSGAEITGEPAEGMTVEIEGTLEGATIIATEVEIKEPEE